MVGFREIPQNLRVPLFFAELDNSRANSGTAQVLRTLIIGQQGASGTYPAGIPVLMEGVPSVKVRSGPGTMLALMAEWYRKRDSFGETWVLPLADNPAGVVATGTITVTSAATAAGTLNLYVAGDRVQVYVAPSQTTAQIAAAIAASINADTDQPVTAAATTNAVTLTAKHKGTIGNDIDLRLNYRGSAGGEATPPGLAVTISPMSGGTTAPVLDTALAILGDMPFDFIICPYTDSTSLDALKTFLASRWSWDRMLYGGAFTAFRGTLSAVNTQGLSRNDSHVVTLPFNGSPRPAWLWAANFGGAAAVSLRADPGLPLQGLALDVEPPPVESRWNIGERNGLLFAGMSTSTVQDDGTVVLETIVTNYRTNVLGQPDDSYLYVERLYTLAAAIRRLKASTTSKFGRFKLASDGTAFAPGSNIVTPSIIKDHILGEYRAMERAGLVQEYETFRRNLVVERNASNRCRVDGLVPIVPIDQLRQLAMLVQFRNSGEA
ncbi:phage tail sheath subtilisin-like domain-containing protein [Pararoseomonas indoligenes]|uniref:Phage tail sheath subtilisin-like domain-containing protein n=1 Tax=Roseomonas indoligenes TaxID=2820811 RepID=A0A940MRK1_9PROT|nr:phage tail sheath subtilisin-like domain-containing protein [Pararoseomonas indoligenes]MBP0492169.1 phage tail sheath subtilisin-like domain-containing protein [Pararoseomonas indoligenes]